LKLPRGVRIDLKVFDAVVCVFVDLIEADLFGIGSGRKQSDRTSNKGKAQKPFQLARGAVEILQHNRTRIHEDRFGVTGEVGLYWWWSGWLQLAVELVCSCVLRQWICGVRGWRCTGGLICPRRNPEVFQSEQTHPALKPRMPLPPIRMEATIEIL